MSNSQTNWREWIKTVSVALVPIVVVYLGYLFNESLREKDTRARYVELAISILREPPKPETKEIRAWAIKLIDTHSDVPLTPNAKIELGAAGTFFFPSDDDLKNPALRRYLEQIDRLNKESNRAMELHQKLMKLQDQILRSTGQKQRDDDER